MLNLREADCCQTCWHWQKDGLYHCAVVPRPGPKGDEFLALPKNEQLMARAIGRDWVRDHETQPFHVCDLFKSK